MEGNEADFSPSEPIRPLLESEMENLTLEDGDVDLETFRKRWKAELQQNKMKEELEKAEKLFREGCDHEKAGNMCEAVKFYTKAVKLVPDIEHHVYRRDNDGGTSKGQQAPSTSKAHNRKDDAEKLDLIEIFNGRLRERETLFLSDDSRNPIFMLPKEVLRLILRYVVGCGLDVRSLETVSTTSIYFYLLARENDIWHRICRKSFDLAASFVPTLPSWREMYLWTPHIQFFGVYLAKVTYIRHGENSYQDKFYKPWHMVTYYRILRFFANGSVLMTTTSENPSSIVGFLKTRKDARNSDSIIGGEYWIDSGSICIKLTEHVNRKQSRQVKTINSRRLRGVVAPHELIEKNFYLELKFSQRRSHAKSHGILLWSKYEYSHVLVDGSVSKGDFHVAGDSQTYPPFYLSRVKSFASPEGFDDVLC